LSCTAAARAQAQSPAQDHAPAWSSRAPQELLDVVRAALAAHPSLAAAGARADAAEAQAREASAQRLPQLSADWAATRFAEPMIVAPLHGFDPQRPPRFERMLLQGGVTLGYTLFDGGARGAGGLGRARAAGASGDAGARARGAALRRRAHGAGHAAACGGGAERGARGSNPRGRGAGGGATRAGAARRARAGRRGRVRRGAGAARPT